MLKEHKEPFSIHMHTDVSNFRLRDCINSPEKLIDYSIELGLPGIAITDHETLSSHIKASKYVEGKDFKLGFGNEIYLVDKKTILEARENNERVQFHHFLLLAKNKKGYEFLKKQSSKAWENNFYFRGAERVPTYYDELEELMQDYKGDVIASSACLGGHIPQAILKYHETRNEEDKKEIMRLIKWCVKVFGKDDFYLELQPSKNEEQLIVNKILLQLGKQLGIKCIVTTDAHYLNKEQAMAHKIYLQASQGDREVDSFYATTYVMNREELLNFFEEDILDELINNTHQIKDKLEPIAFKQQTQVPDIDIPLYQPNRVFEDYYGKYEYINKYAHSGREMDRYYLHLLGEGMLSHNQKFNEENLSRIDIELEQIWEISKKLNQPLSSYFVLAQDIVNMMWEVSLVGTARGSAACYLTNYLLGIVQINPLKYDLPYYRFLSKEQEVLPDIDLDSQASKRDEIIQLAKERYGHEKILNSCTFTTEGPKSTVITSSRGYGLDVSEQHNIANLIPNEGALLWSVSDCFFGNEKKGRKPVKEFIDRVEQHEGLKDVMLSIEGIVSGRSQHASSVIFYPRKFTDVDGMMKTTKGLPVTQFNADDGEYAGNLKMDFLSISALDSISEAIDLLLKDGKIEWQGSIRATYDKYFHPDVLDMTSHEMFDMLADGEIFDAFQMSSLVAQNAMKKIRPETFDELTVTNTIIRLQTEGESPTDKFVRYKKDIQEWYKDMDKYGLSKDEISLMERHLLQRTGICDTQEILMGIIIDTDIANGGLNFANRFRKSVGKKDEKKIEKACKEFYEVMKKNGQSEKFAQYIIEEQFALQFSYAFSLPHTVAYSLILMIEMNIAHKYGVGYWKGACLNAAIFSGDEMSSSKDYAAISEYVNSMKEDVSLPDINKSELKFKTENGKVLFGLAAILGLDSSTLNNIIENKPFKSLDDYYERMVETKLTSAKKTISLIKSGAMDSLENKNRRQIMADLVKMIVPPKEKITIVQLPYVRNILPSQFDNILKLHDFRNRIEGRNKEKMNEEIEKIFIANYSKDVEYEFKDGQLSIDMKSWKKYYDKAIKSLKEELKKEKYVREFTKQKRIEYWKKECSGTVPEWEIETILFNRDEFALDVGTIGKRYELSNFKDLRDNPSKGRNSRGFIDYEISAIAGIVVGYDNMKRLVYLLTKDSGVVIVKVSRKNYSKYQEKLENDSSWWERGNSLIVLGYKSGASFNMRGNHIYRNPVIKIEKNNRKYVYRSEKG